MKSTLILTSDIVLALDGISVWPWQKVVIPTSRTRRGCVSTMPAPTFRLTLEKENNRWRVFIQKETEKPTTACLMMTMSSYDIIIFLCSIFRLARSFLFRYFYGDTIDWILFWTSKHVYSLTMRGNTIQQWKWQNKFSGSAANNQLVLINFWFIQYLTFFGHSRACI